MSEEKKMQEAHMRCATIKNSLKRDNCYKQMGVKTKEMKKNHKKRLSKAEEKC